MDILFLIGGLLLILLGANGLTDGVQTDGASAVAKRFHIPNIVIGLTIVAFGTSAPELAVSVSSALKGSADIAVGNVVGSNIFNALMIVGCTAMFAPIVVQRNTLLKEIPLCILASLALLVMGNDMLLDHAAENVVSITDGLILLCFMAIFLSYTFAIAKTNQAPAPSPTAEVGNNSPTVTAEDGTEIKDMPLWRSTLYIIGGLAGLIWGGQLFVDGASGIARSLGVSESVTRSRRHLAARTGHQHRSGAEKEPRNSHRQRGRQQPVQHLLRIGLLSLHHASAPNGHQQFGPAGTCSLQHSVVDFRRVLRQAHHYTY